MRTFKEFQFLNESDGFQLQKKQFMKSVKNME